MANDCSLAKLGQISLGSTFEVLFFSQFNNVFGCNDSTSDVCAWVHLLSDFTPSQTNTTKSALMAAQWSIRASCMALYGSIARDPIFQEDARKWYTKSLNLQQSILAAESSPFMHGQGRRSTRRIGPLESFLIPPIMMCFYEVITRNSPDDDVAWTIHMEAAANILKLLGGPKALRESGSHMAWELYRTIRLGILCSSVGKEKSHFFSDKEWITQAIRPSEMRPFDRLVDIMISLPEYLSQSSQMNVPPREEDPAGHTPNFLLQTRVHINVMDKLDDWQQDNKAHILSFSESLLRAPLAEHQILLESIRVKNGSAYILTAMCFAGYVIAYKILYSISRPECEKRITYLEQQSQYADAILSIFFIARSPASSMHWVFPLRAVSSFALSSSQQGLAMNCLQTLSKNAGVGDLAQIF
ncbi:hypothetical protein N7490_007252 [Penicillium lividum]|nr:hypothetical protein N7490_007252 [Penicillium lividum]